SFAWFVLMIASVGVFISIGLKYVWFVFFQEDSGLRPKDPPLNMQIAMILFSAICIGLGIYPELLYNMLPYAVDYEPYSVSHIITMLQLLLFAGLSFFMLLPIMKRMLAMSLDFDWLYRFFIPKMAKPIIEAGDALNIKVRACFMSILGSVIDNTVGYKAGRDSFTWILRTCGSIVWIMVMLVMYLLMCYYA
ncbi:MAG: Na+/H+ antiporter subunit D, partial [Alphaproteobacteria bacterium]|nr:Na+/H+ antiporter subunit D [Alphaproteobacteria bacterium]